jgi:hypothetical protein
MLLKKSLLVATVSLLTSACTHTPKPSEPDTQKIADKPVSNTNTVTVTNPNLAATLRDLITLSEAEEIMGERMLLADSSTTKENDGQVYKCAYKAYTEDPKSRKTGSIYFLAQVYNDTSSAKQRYTFIKTANEGHGIKVLEGLGDEAYFHTDKENFYFVMVRVGTTVFNMKVNKITSTTSLDAFNRVTVQITSKLTATN